MFRLAHRSQGRCCFEPRQEKIPGYVKKEESSNQKKQWDIFSCVGGIMNTHLIFQKKSAEKGLVTEVISPSSLIE